MKWLEPIKKRAVKKERFAVFDIEANDWTRFEMMGFFDGTNYEQFNSVEDFLDTVLTKEFRGVRMYAHNGGRYDFRFILDEMSQNPKYTERFELRHLFTADRIRELVIIDKNKHRWYFADSFALLPAALKKLTYDFDVKHKKKDDVDYSDIRKDRARDKIYLQHDCLGLYEVLEAYFAQEIFKGIKIKGTIASNAMQIWRTSLKTPIKRVSRRMEDFIRQSYFGGRVECFRLLGRNVNHYDFNSLYPSVMLDNEMPTGFPVWVNEYIPNEIGFYEAECDMPDSIHIPPLPVIKDGKLIFPVGKFSGFFASCEMEAAAKLGAKFKITRGVVFYTREKLFDSYIKKLHKMKQTADKDSAVYFISKIFLNGLYGKFGQKPEKETVVKTSFDDAVKRELIPYLPELNLYKENRVSFAGYLLPHIASWITAHARLKLFRTLQESADPLYCDTDSIFTTERLQTSPDKLGRLKFEGEYSRAAFLMPKLYSYIDGSKTIVKAKGFGKKLLEQVDFNSFLKGLEGDFGDFRREERKLLGIKTGWNRFGKTLVMGTDRKSIKSVYDKRIVHDDLTTSPHILCGHVSELN